MAQWDTLTNKMLAINQWRKSSSNANENGSTSFGTLDHLTPAKPISSHKIGWLACWFFFFIPNTTFTLILTMGPPDNVCRFMNVLLASFQGPGAHILSQILLLVFLEQHMIHDNGEALEDHPDECSGITEGRELGRSIRWASPTLLSPFLFSFVLYLGLCATMMVTKVATP